MRITFIKKKPKKISEDSKVVIDLIKLLEANENKNPTNSELAIYLAKNCRVIVV